MALGREAFREALTFDDVLLVPRRSEVHPRDTDLSSRFTRAVQLNVPLASAAMDTVTEARMAIAMAREGGIGVIHKNLSVDKQAEKVDRVKRSESGMILHPVTLPPGGRIRDALRLMEEFKISGVPIVDPEGRLVGIVTNRDLMFENDPDRLLSEIMTSQGLVTTPAGTTLEQAERILHKHKIEKLPVVDGDGTLRGLITVKDITKKRLFPNAAKDEHGRLRVAAAVGTTPESFERAAALRDARVDVIVVDTAHAQSGRVLRTVERMREQFPDVQLVAGNVSTEEGARDLVERGVDAVKVGQGPGSICTTRVIAGIGVPQVTAVIDCARVTRDAGVPLISDGGIKYTGDIVKAIAAGADSVMMGGMFAGTEEAPGETVLLEGRSFKVYRGMGSVGAMAEGSSDRYFQEDAGSQDGGGRKFVPEGIEGRVPYKGKVSESVFQMVGGLRQGMGYCGCRDLEELRTLTEFVRVTMGGLVESHPHDVIITREAPNYNK
ncbi:MAG: IMP dehydrogenase [Gemmatimonadetes bacterium]|nr:IMP dehydrogenase [Gemmatimonadota bacterium]